MIHKIKRIKPVEDTCIEAFFFNGDVKRYDVKQLFVMLPQFMVLEKDKQLFESVQVDGGGYGVSWSDALDLDAETIWEEGVLIEVEKEADLNHLLAYSLSLAREQANMTQKELSVKTGIYQADISKIERGLGNPSLTTLKRLAEGVGAELKIDFVIKDIKNE